MNQCAMNVCLRDGSIESINMDKINHAVQWACEGLPGASWSDLALAAQIEWFDGISTTEIDQSVVMAARTKIAEHPDYAYVAARLQLRVLYQSVFGPTDTRRWPLEKLYQGRFEAFVARGVALELFDARLLQAFDLKRLSAAIAADRDRLFKAQGVQILADRYLTREREADGHGERPVLELPQWLWMRVGMGLSLAEDDPTGRAIDFYELMSRLRYVPSTPTLFNSALVRSQCSSCYLTQVGDSIESIHDAYGQMMFLSKFAGGVGTDWTPVRATGSMIRGTNGPSQGVIPFIKIQDDIAVAVNQGSKRKGAHCAYLETWHLDIEDFLELRKNVGDERRRTHNMNTANWIPDLFMARVAEKAEWTLFSPSDAADLHDLYGQAFKQAYEAHEAAFERGEIRGKRVSARELWKKMLRMLFETGHPWLTFKDACNIRSPQDHVGVVHNSNLCTEITLNNDVDETAVCNIGSVNLAAHVRDGEIDNAELRCTVTTAMRMLDNVITVGFYPTAKAERGSTRHRPVGLGVMGYQDALYALGIAFASDRHIAFADEIMERLSYHAIEASSDLAVERGAYATYGGSKWERGLFPLDTLDLLAAERGLEIAVDRGSRLDWEALKAKVAGQGMRNSNTMAIAPTATIANISGVSPTIEPTFRNLYVVSNLSGEFTVVNEALVRDLEARGLWDTAVAQAIKAGDGDLKGIVDDETLLSNYPQAFDIDQRWLIRAAAARGKWIDQSQSLNLFVARPNGRALHELYLEAWRMGLKTTYYLRSQGASQVNKATVDATRAPQQAESDASANACAIDNPDCESCQ